MIVTQSKKNTYHLNCLGRSNMAASLAQKGCTITTSMVHGEEFRTLLKEKLREELEEFIVATSREEMIAELADIHEVLDAVYKEYGIEYAAVMLQKEQKHAERGSFNGMVIETISCEAGSKAEQHLIERGRKKV